MGFENLYISKMCPELVRHNVYLDPNIHERLDLTSPWNLFLPFDLNIYMVYEVQRDQSWTRSRPCAGTGSTTAVFTFWQEYENGKRLVETHAIWDATFGATW